MMLYVQRNEAGAIVAVFSNPKPEAEEALSPRAPEFLDFLSSNESDDPSLCFLADTDINLVRVLEDLIDAMVEKRLIRFTDLPSIAQEKLLSRRFVRDKLGTANPVLVEDEKLL